MVKEVKNIYLKKYARVLKGSYKYLPIIIPIVFFSFLVLSNLNNRTMYADESVTAMLGKNILLSGYPKAWDGNNLVMASVNGNEFNDSLVYIRDNWLSYYMAALGQLIGNILGLDPFGSVLCMRILFALISILGIIGFYFLVKDITRNKTVTFIALLLYSTSIPAILHFRSIYYVALIPTFFIATLLFYRKTIEKKRWIYCSLFILSATLLFHSLFLHFFIAMFSITVIYFVFDIKKENIKYFLVSMASIGLFTLPWWIYQRSYLSKVETSLLSNNELFWDTILGYIWQVQAYYFPFLTLGVIGVLFILINKIQNNRSSISTEMNTSKAFTLIKIKKHFNNKSNRYRIILTIAGPIFFNIILVSTFSSFLETRWLLACVPFLFISAAYLLTYIKEQVQFVGISVLLLIILTNGLHVAPYLLLKQLTGSSNAAEVIVKPPVPFYSVNESGWFNKKADLAEYLEKMCFIQSYPISLFEEISNEFYDADKGMVLFFNKYANKDQKVYMVGYQFETICYYNNLKVVNRLDPVADPLPNLYHSYPNATTYYHLTYYPVIQCDWIIERVAGVTNAEWHNDELFERIYIDFPESDPWNEIWAHTFYTDRSYSGFYIYRNRKTTVETDLQGIFSIANIR
jgi:hypothetical protein